MKKKGFTLIELLAVIIVLAIIALIATPRVIKYIEEGQKRALSSSASNLIKQAQMNCSSGEVCYFTVEDGKLYESDESDAKGAYVTSTGGKNENGQVRVDSDGLGYVALYNGKWCAHKNAEEQTVDIKDYVEGECKQEDLYTVTFDPNGGRVDQTSKLVKLNENYGKLPIPTRTGYTFKGWNGKNLLNLNVDRSYPSSTNFSNDTPRTFTEKSYIKGIAYNNYFDDNDSRITNYEISDNSVSISSTYSGYGVGFAFLSNENEHYSISYNSNGDEIQSMLFYDINGNLISYDFRQLNRKKFITPEGTMYLVIQFSTKYSVSTTYSNIQLEEGDTATPYEPYYITKDTKVVQNKNHTLKAIWEKNS